jgi:hypothetical protein
MLFSLGDAHLPIGLVGIVLPVGLTGIVLVVGLADVGLAAVLLDEGGRVMLWSCCKVKTHPSSDGCFLFCFKFCRGRAGAQPLRHKTPTQSRRYLRLRRGGPVEDFRTVKKEEALSTSSQPAARPKERQITTFHRMDSYIQKN